MVKSQNTKVDWSGKGMAYLSMTGNVGQFLVGDKALEFYSDSNVANYIQIPWQNVVSIGANVSKRKVSRHFEVITTDGKFLFACKESGQLLKAAREYVGNEKIVKLPTLLQMVVVKIKKFFKK